MARRRMALTVARTAATAAVAAVVDAADTKAASRLATAVAVVPGVAAPPAAPVAAPPLPLPTCPSLKITSPPCHKQVDMQGAGRLSGGAGGLMGRGTRGWRTRGCMCVGEKRWTTQCVAGGLMCYQGSLTLHAVVLDT